MTSRGSFFFYIDLLDPLFMKVPLDLRLLDGSSLVVLSDFFCQWRRNPIVCEVYLALLIEIDVRAGHTTTPPAAIVIDLEMVQPPIVVEAIRTIGAAGVRCAQLVLLRGAAFCTETIAAIVSEAERLQKPLATALH